MSLSDQYPYTLLVASGLRPPSLAKARVDVGDNTNAYLASADVDSFQAKLNHPHPTLEVSLTPEMEFMKNHVKKIWGNQAFVSSQLDGVSFTMEGISSQLVALEQVASNFSHFIIEHWIPAQAILVNLHNATCPSCQKADTMSGNWTCRIYVFL